MNKTKHDKQDDFGLFEGKSSNKSKFSLPELDFGKSCEAIVAVLVLGLLIFITVMVIKINSNVLLLKSQTNELSENSALLNFKVDRISQHKCQVLYITPVKFQAKRGTCWDFTTLGILEQTYRREGVEKGWLSDLEYVKFSEHAYGVAVIEYCRANEQQCPHVRLASNSTDGGFISWLYFFQPLHDKIVPDSVCPYIEEATNDNECGDYHAYLNKNPLKFKVTGMKTMYDIEIIKEQLRIKKNAMAWVSILGTVTYYAPCTGAFTNTSACREERCTPCPLDLNYPTKCCIKESRAGWTLDGEFYVHREMEEVGAHAMTLVGYNDNFVTQEGHKGGFIVKNSWGAWHSHSLQYWMNEMSGINEDEVCPNSRNPRNWEAGKTILTCADTHYCDEGVTYSLMSINHGPDGTYVMCFQRGESEDGLPLTKNFGHSLDSQMSATLECSPPMPLDLYADFFQPVASQTYPNDEDSCGYFFFPYEVAQEISRKFGFFWVSDFDVEWLPQSYIANQDKYAELDYSQIKLSTTKSYIPTYPDALPFFPPEDDDFNAKTLKRVSPALIFDTNDKIPSGQRDSQKKNFIEKNNQKVIGPRKKNTLNKKQ